ncbi:MAG: NAD(P)/FAD-dependent oxidoreductase [Rhodospirillaceae bacterium]|nr:NAD(P)/FAD-dependent oxidoreductase [Rhodospirillaceae bacterium]
MTETVECAVIGAGVVGLAVARALAQSGRDVLILEAAPTFGTGVSARSSEVLHAGIYYAPGSEKARFCAPGAKRLRHYLEERAIGFRPTGKLIVAQAGEEAALDALKATGEANGVEGLTLLTAAQARALEPELSLSAALWSPATGILDSHGLMLSLLADAEAAGADLATHSPALSGRLADDGIEIAIGGRDPCRLRARYVVNAAGLGAQALASRIDGLPAQTVPPLYFCKGSYFLPEGRAPFSRLVYPTPSQAGLGIHYTLDLAGQGRFGPDTEWIETENYTLDESRGQSFRAAIERYWPGLGQRELRPGYAGIRPKIQAPDDPARDFAILGPKDHGVTGLVNLFGIESPGLTACLAIATHVEELLS